jgi:ElaB/YqjD/DUF883 family membrane-anchored ribosome-binding protein
MGIEDWAGDKTGEPVAQGQSPDKSTGFENVKNIIADKLHDVAEALGEKAAGKEAHSGIVHCGKQASEWLDQSAGYVRQFDYRQADARVREYVRQNPGRSLMIAGGVGLIIGAVCRRR